ncbi:MAG: transposase [Spirochaetales bacterium]|nr:transposase [Spirochaetales bacterium]
MLTTQGVFVLLLLGVGIDTHFHMEIRPNKNENLSEIMKYIKQKFTQWINRTFNLEESAWKDRFFSI